MKNNKIEINDELFADCLPNSHYDFHGYYVVSTSIHKLKYFNDENSIKLLNILPNEITNDDNNMLIKSKNLKRFIETEFACHSKTINDIKNYDESLIVYEYDEPAVIENANLIEFMSNELMKKSTFEINENKIIVIKFNEISDVFIELIKKYKNK